MDKKTDINKYIIPILSDYVVFGIAMSFAGIFLLFFIARWITDDIIWAAPFLLISLAYICLFRFKAKKNMLTGFNTYFFYAVTIFFSALTAVFTFLTKGIFESRIFDGILAAAFPFWGLYGLCSLEDKKIFVFGMYAVYITASVTCAVLTKKRGILPVVLCCLASAAFCAYTIKYIPNYSGHGFDYMNGYSSTDFTGYHVYDGEKLATLDHKPSLFIENEKDMPVLDGAEACYPLYSAVAKAVYKDIDNIEARSGIENKDEWGRPTNGKIVTFTNTIWGYDRLIDKEIDLMFGARPSQNQKKCAADEGEQIVSVPIGKEAFVFFVEEDNPINDISFEDVKKIYSGEITNWSELGGKKQKIIAFQRPEESGSQVTMLYFMGDTPLKEPVTYETVDAMAGVIKRVANYVNENGAIGYSFRYFLEELNQEKHVKILSIDGVYPTVENIENGSYPLTVNLVCAKLKSNNKPYVQKMLEFLRSEDGKQIIRQTGYAPLDGNDIKEIAEE